MSAYRHKGRVAFHETDAAGIVYFANFFRYAEEAETAALHELGLLLSPLREGMMIPRVHVEADYHHPLRFWDEYVVQAQVVKVGGCSLHWSFDLYCGDVLCSTIRWVSARIGADGARVQYTDEERECLMTWA